MLLCCVIPRVGDDALMEEETTTWRLEQGRAGSHFTTQAAQAHAAAFGPLEERRSSHSSSSSSSFGEDNAQRAQRTPGTPYFTFSEQVRMEGRRI
eukprot:1157273-Pelagomonas_calceolata.AAC.1